MRTILMGLLTLGLMLSTPGRAAAGGVLGWHGGGGCGFAPPVAAYPYPYAYPYGYYAPGAIYPPYAFRGSYFRPDIPPGWNTQRNWRDTWQDDGVKLHTYTLH
jgi:hypothetical protein